MTKKSTALIVVAIILGGVYAVGFSGWFGKKSIRIEHTVRSLRDAWGGDGKKADATGRQVNNVMFSLHKDYRLTSVKVVSAAEFETNRYAHPLWHMVSEQGSKPVDAVTYGLPIAGMKSAVAEIQPETLKPGVSYRLLVEAGSIKGEHDFEVPQVAGRR